MSSSTNPRTSSPNPFTTMNSEQAGRAEPSTSSKREGGSAASTSTGHPSGAMKRSAGGKSLWDQWMTSSGWFSPLVPPEAPEKLLEKQRQAEEERRIEKERSVHSWRESQDTTSPMKNSSNATRPSLMKRLSSAVELKWWAADAPAPGEDGAVEEEDMQHPRGRGFSISSTGSRKGQQPSLSTMQENEHDSEPSPSRNSQEIQMR